jgi:mono/diheme cytochrome c family protein
MNRLRIVGAGLVFFLGIAHAASQSPWLQHVSPSDREKTNPYAGSPDAVAAGSRMFTDHCSKCHGSDALGRGKRPSLRSKEVQQATDGEIFWLLKNGSLRKGMPSWSSLPEPTRWQVIAYVKSLGEMTAPANAAREKRNDQ